YPTLGALVAREAGAEDSNLPPFVSIAPFRRLSAAAHSPGFLGPRYAPLIVGEEGSMAPPAADASAKALRVATLTPHAGLAGKHQGARLRLVRQMQDEFVEEHPSALARSHQTAYQRAVRLMRTRAAKTFDLDEEPARLRDAYGRSRFGQGCLLA